VKSKRSRRAEEQQSRRSAEQQSRRAVEQQEIPLLIPPLTKGDN